MFDEQIDRPSQGKTSDDPVLKLTTIGDIEPNQEGHTWVMNQCKS